MTTFEDQLRADSAAFFNQNEFEEEIEWNGTRSWYDAENNAHQPIKAVIEKDDSLPMEEMGVFSEQRTVFIPEPYIDRPVPAEEITLNGNRYVVRSVDADGGMLEILIYRTRA